MAFLDQERQRGGVAAGWRETREPLKDQIILDVIRLSHWHFAETGNPVFAFRALGLERFLSAQHAEQLAWAHDYLAVAAGELLALVNSPPKDGRHWCAAAKALGFRVGRNLNPFRKARQLAEADHTYIAVEQLLRFPGGTITRAQAITEVANQLGITESKARAAYYRTRKLVATEPNVKLLMEMLL